MKSRHRMLFLSTGGSNNVNDDTDWNATKKETRHDWEFKRQCNIKEKREQEENHLSE